PGDGGAPRGRLPQRHACGGPGRVLDGRGGRREARGHAARRFDPRRGPHHPLSHGSSRGPGHGGPGLDGDPGRRVHARASGHVHSELREPGRHARHRPWVRAPAASRRGAVRHGRRGPGRVTIRPPWPPSTSCSPSTCGSGRSWPRKSCGAPARIAPQIVERRRDAEGLVLVGVRTRGVPLARRLARLVAEAGAPPPPVGALDITLYRDDLTTVAPQPVLRGTEIPGSIDGRTVVLVDDVLYTGRTIRAALDEI